MMTVSTTPESVAEPATNVPNDIMQNASKAEPEKADTHLTGIPLYVLASSMLLLMFVITLDISILATAIPRITDDFHTIADIGWYASAYLISQCALQPLSGRIYSHFPFKISFLSFFLVFELGSLLCGVSRSSKMLIVGRAVCGIGSAGLVNGSLTVLGVASPPGKRPAMMGLFMSAASCGQVIGPLIGGGLTQHVSWRWCFYINLPIGAVTIIGFIFTKLPDARAPKSGHSAKATFLELDIPGFIQFAPACVMLLLALEWGGNKYPWNSATIIGLLCGSGVLFIVFAFWERRHGDRAMIPGSLLGIRAVFSSCITTLFQGGAMLILTYYLAIWFQVIKDASPTKSGVFILPNFVSQVLMSIVLGVLVSKVGYVLPFMIIGNSFNTISYGLLSTLKVSSGAGDWIGFQILAGCGRGMAMQMPILAVQASVPMAKIATVTAMVMFSQFFGAAIFLSAAQTLFVHLLRSALHVYAPSVDASAVITAGATGYASVVPAEFRPDVKQAYDTAIAHTFYLGIAVAAASVFSSFGVGALKADTKKLKTGGKADPGNDQKLEDEKEELRQPASA